MGGARRQTRLDLRYDAPPEERGIPGAGPSPRRLVVADGRSCRVAASAFAEAGAHPTPIIDRFWFKSIYFREPSGVLFEVATVGPGFTADEPLETLGEHLTLPPDYEHLRAHLEQVLTPLPDPRTARARS